VLDASRVLAGPYAAMMLGDLGAEVIKLERPDGGDQTRAWGPPYLKGESAYYLSVNRNKRSLILDLKQKAGQEIFKRLAQNSDVVIENFRPGTLEALGLGYEQIVVQHPEVIWCSITGYGHDSPWKDRPAYDIALQAESGLMSITGEDGGPPVRIGVAIVDILTAHQAVQAIEAALYWREKSGQGQWIDMALLDCGVAFLSYMAQFQFATDVAPGRMGSEHPTISPYQAFATADHFIVVAVGSPDIWVRFCQALGETALAKDVRFSDNAKRVANRQALTSLLAKIFQQKPLAQWLHIMQSHNVPATPVNDLSEIWNLPPLQKRAMCQTVQHPTIGPLPLLASPMKLSKTPPQMRLPPPLLGEHTKAILKELGFE